MDLESPMTTPMWKYEIGNRRVDFHLQRHPMILEHIGPHAVGIVFRHRPKHLFCAIGSEQDIVIEHQDAVACDFIMREYPLRHHSFLDPDIFLFSCREVGPIISIGNVHHHPFRLHGLGADGLQFLSELVPGRTEGADGDGIGRKDRRASQ